MTYENDNFARPRLEVIVKRFWLSLLVGLFVMTPTVVFGEQKLPAEVELTSQVTPTGDVEFFWNVGALQQINLVDLQIGYSYDQGDHPGIFKPQHVDALLGEAAFRNLSLDSTFTFDFHLNTGDGRSFSQLITLKTPKPNRTPSTDPGINAQLAYADSHWQTRVNPNYLYIPSNDCANFASQTLVARGMPETQKWNQKDLIPTHSFVSATALKTYLLEQPGVRELSDGQRDQVKLGDLVMFDWNRSGDTDHTGVVDFIQKQADGTIRIYFAQHTLHRQYRSVDWAIQIYHPNAFVSFLSIPENQTPLTWSSLFAASTAR